MRYCLSRVQSVMMLLLMQIVNLEFAVDVTDKDLQRLHGNSLEDLNLNACQRCAQPHACLHFLGYVLICTVCMHDACIIISSTTSMMMQSLASMSVCPCFCCAG